MRNLDKLLREARSLIGETTLKVENEYYSFHILNNGYCYSCKGKCKCDQYYNVLLEVDDIKVVNTKAYKTYEELHYDDVPDDVFERIGNAAKVKGEELRKELAEYEESR